MRNIFAETLYKYATKDKKIHIVVADVSPAGSMEKFRKEYPERFINVGVAEQAMIGVSAGLAMRGMKPFAYTIANFALYRPFEMIRNDLCYQNLPVTIVGMGAGTIYSSLGYTHLTQEDISIAKSIPNMTILAPSDPLELIESIKYCCTQSKSPIYLRIGKTGEKTFTSQSVEKWKFGKIRKICQGNKICILTYGPIINIAFDVKENLNKKNIQTSLYSVHTLKPIDKARLKKIFLKYKTIVIIEDHSAIGGLGEMVKSQAFDNNYRGTIISKSLKDKFYHSYGNQKNLQNLHGINPLSITKEVLKIYNNG